MRSFLIEIYVSGLFQAHSTAKGQPLGLAFTVTAPMNVHAMHDVQAQGGKQFERDIELHLLEHAQRQFIAKIRSDRDLARTLGKTKWTMVSKGCIQFGGSAEDLVKTPEQRTQFLQKLGDDIFYRTHRHPQPMEVSL